jgi:phosphatidylglycerol:prolipoprotein diacylglycerol transferase
MYPGISDLLNDLFGTHFASSFPPSFGTLVAISFLLGAWTLMKELKRKEQRGLLIPVHRKIMVGEKAKPSELFWNGLFGFLLGFKIVYAFLNSDTFFGDPQKTILSTHGNVPAGLITGLFFVWLKYREKEKLKKSVPELTDTTIHPYELISEITMAAAIGGLLGAKIFHLLEYWDDFIADPAGMFFSGSGLTMYGGLIVGAIAVLWYGRKNNIPPLVLCDASAPGLMLAYGVGRLGCQIAGDGDWGIVNTVPKPSLMGFLPDWFWSYTYPHNVVNEGIPIDGCIGHHCNQLAEGVFPTPLYESISCILLFFLLWSMRKKINVPGILFSWYLLFNGIERFLIESIRINSKYHLAGIAFSQAQLISFLMIIGSVIGLFYFRSKKKSYA